MHQCCSQSAASAVKEKAELIATLRNTGLTKQADTEDQWEIYNDHAKNMHGNAELVWCIQCGKNYNGMLVGKTYTKHIKEKCKHNLNKSHCDVLHAIFEEIKVTINYLEVYIRLSSHLIMLHM